MNIGQFIFIALAGDSRQRRQSCRMKSTYPGSIQNTTLCNDYGIEHFNISTKVTTGDGFPQGHSRMNETRAGKGTYFHSELHCYDFAALLSG